MIPDSEEENQRSLRDHLVKTLPCIKKNPIILLDADRTLYEPDSSRILNDLAGIDLDEIKRGFVEHGYTYPGFLNMARIYSRIPVDDFWNYVEVVANQIHLYPGVSEFLGEASKWATVICVSSGIGQIVRKVLENNGFGDIPVIAGIHSELDSFVIGREEKGVIPDYFRERYYGETEIVAMGDSDVDSLMLQRADHAVIVVNHRNNADLMPHLKTHTSVRQITFKDYMHPGIPFTTYYELAGCISLNSNNPNKQVVKSLSFHEYTRKNAIQLLATQSRRIDITPVELAQVHQEMGKYLSYQIVDEFSLEECQIQHPQGTKTGQKIKNEKDIVILACVRAGIYVGEGVRFFFPESPYYHIRPIRGQGISDIELGELPDLAGKSIIIVDSVINTGGTINPVINQLQKQNPAQIIVVCLVMPDTTAEVFKNEYTEEKFYVARISTNKYVGKGQTDTGNRLFGTFSRE